MIFEGRKPSDLQLSEVRSILGHREDLEVDFKRKAYSQTGKLENEWKMDLLKDIASFANTNGGYLFIGVEPDEKQGKKFINIENAESESQSMYNICSKFISAKLVEDELVIEPIPVDRHTNIIIARVLAGQNKPYMITLNDNTLFYVRCDNGREGYNRSMLTNEIKDVFLKDRVSLKLYEIDKKVDYLTDYLTKDGP